MIAYFYKIVKVLHDGSFVSSYVPGKACCTYTIGQITRAPEWLAKEGYHLTVFDDKHIALRWLYGSLTLANTCMAVLLAKADVTDIAARPARSINFEFLKSGVFPKIMSSDTDLSDEEWPNGTVFVRQLEVMDLLYKLDDSALRAFESFKL